MTYYKDFDVSKLSFNEQYMIDDEIHIPLCYNNDKLLISCSRRNFREGICKKIDPVTNKALAYYIVYDVNKSNRSFLDMINGIESVTMYHISTMIGTNKLVPLLQKNKTSLLQLSQSKYSFNASIDHCTIFNNRGGNTSDEMLYNNVSIEGTPTYLISEVVITPESVYFVKSVYSIDIDCYGLKYETTKSSTVVL